MRLFHEVVVDAASVYTAVILQQIDSLPLVLGSGFAVAWVEEQETLGSRTRRIPDLRQAVQSEAMFSCFDVCRGHDAALMR